MENIEGTDDKNNTVECPGKRVFFLALYTKHHFFFPLASRGGADTATTVSAGENTSGRTGTEEHKQHEIQAVDMRTSYSELVMTGFPEKSDHYDLGVFKSSEAQKYINKYM